MLCILNTIIMVSCVINDSYCGDNECDVSNDNYIVGGSGPILKYWEQAGSSP